MAKHRIIHSFTGMAIGTVWTISDIHLFLNSMAMHRIESCVPRATPSGQLGCSQPVLKVQSKEFLAFLLKNTCLVVQYSEGSTFLRFL